MRLTKTLFISDLHLDPARPEATARFHRFLEGAVPGADALYILGDLFEYWVGDDGLVLDFPKAIAADLSRVSRDVPLYFMHGDTLCTDDLAYQRFRAQVRSPAWQQAVLARPLAERVAMAKGLREESDSAKQGKSMEIMDVSRDAVERAFAESGCDVMIHGHTHRPGHHVYRVEGRDRERWVLPDWYRGGGYLEASPSGIRAVEAA